MVDNISSHNNIKSHQKCPKKTQEKLIEITRSDNCFDQENDSTCCDATTSLQRTCSNGMTSFEKQPPLFRGHVQTQ